MFVFVKFWVELFNKSQEQDKRYKSISYSIHINIHNIYNLLREEASSNADFFSMLMKEIEKLETVQMDAIEVIYLFLNLNATKHYKI